jgi:hypothetical protein
MLCLAVVSLVASFAPPQAQAPSSTAARAPLGDVWAVCTGPEALPSGRLVKLALATGKFERVVEIQGGPGVHEPLEVALLPDGTRALVPQLFGSGTARRSTILQTVALADGRVESEQRFEGWLDALEFHPITGVLWAMHCDNDGQRWLARFDARRSRLEHVGALPGREFPRSLAFSPIGRELWALTCTHQVAGDGVLLLDQANASVLRRLPWSAEHPAHALEIDVSGRLIAAERGGTFYEVDSSNGRLTRLSTVADASIGGIITGLDFPVPAPIAHER